MNDKLSLEEIAKRNLEKRIEDANEAMRVNVLDPFELGLTAELVFSPRGVIAKPVFVDAKKSEKEPSAPTV